MTITVNAADFAAEMDRVCDALREGMAQGVQDAADQIRNRAKHLAPVMTGELRMSIQSELTEEGGDTASARVYTPSQYAIYVHEGTGIYSRTGMGRRDVPWTYYDERTGQYCQTSGMQPTPFLEDAVNEERPNVTRYVSRAVTRALGR